MQVPSVQSEEFGETVIVDAANAPSADDGPMDDEGHTDPGGPTDNDVEPIEVNEWPDPRTGHAPVDVLDADDADDDEEREDASVTGG
jgi:hypothetical protein